jgi:hypothetical protein
MTYWRRTLFLFLFAGLVQSFAGNGEWHRLVRGPLVLHCQKEDFTHGDRILDQALEAIPRILSDLRLEALSSPVTMVIAPDNAFFHQITSGQIPEWGIGAADPVRKVVYLKSRRISGSGNTRKVMVHELSHVLLGMVVGEGEVERWFDEGFALLQADEGEWQDRVRVSKALLFSEPIPLDEIDDVLTFQRDRAALAYEESRAAVEFLVRRFGRRILADIPWNLRSGLSMEESISRSTGLTWDEFQRQWLSDLENRYRWYVFLDFPLVFSILLVLLFFMALIATKRRIRRKTTEWSQEASYGMEPMDKGPTPD